MERLVFLTAPADVSGLPTEFLIFRAGVNDSTQGPVTFDAEAAAMVMKAYGDHGVDKMIDLEHRSLDWDDADPDARGWCQLAVRSGELWAVNVTWTPDGEARLKARTQRYTSPAFMCTYVAAEDGDPQGGFERVSRLINVAMCSMPASYGLEPLVASDKPGLDSPRRRGYGPASMAIAPTAAPAPTPTAPVAAPPAPDAPVLVAAPSASDELLAALLAATGAPTASAALAAVTANFAEVARANSERRRSAVQALIAVGAETPATAWSAGLVGTPVARLASEPVADLESRAAALRALRPASAELTPPPVGEDPAIEGLTASEVKYAESIKDPDHRARFIAARQHTNAKRAGSR